MQIINIFNSANTYIYTDYLILFQVIQIYPTHHNKWNNFYLRLTTSRFTHYLNIIRYTSYWTSEWRRQIIRKVKMDLIVVYTWSYFFTWKKITFIWALQRSKIIRDYSKPLKQKNTLILTRFRHFLYL